MQNHVVPQPTSSGSSMRLVPILLLASLLGVAPFYAHAQGPPPLGTAQSFAVLGASTVSNTGPTIITGDLGVNPGTAISGFPPGIVVGGTTHAADSVALQAQNDTTNAYNSMSGQACDTTFGVPTDIGGLTLVPGVYCFSSSAQLTGALTLDAGGDPAAAWVFKVASTLITASNASVLLINGASQCNVSWLVGSSATIGTSTTFVGNILAVTSITLNTNATLSGRALAQNGAVTLDSNTVSISACTSAVLTPPTVSKSFSPASIAAGGISTLTITLGNDNTTAATLTAPFIDTLPAGVVIAGVASTTCGGSVMAETGGSTVTLTGGAIPANGSCVVVVDVTASAPDNYINSLASGVLQTTNGSNTVPAVATLTVTAAGIAPTLSKSFSPATIAAGGGSTLTITLSNAGDTAATLTAPLVDTLPSGVLLSGPATTTCGGTVTGTTGGSTVTLTGGTIPATGSCTVTAPVSAAVGGSYFNTLAAGALQTSNGDNTTPAVATLVVTPAAVLPPTLSKAFSPAAIKAGEISTLTITLRNPNSTIARLTASLTDSLPAGMLIYGNARTTCGGTVSATKGTARLTLTGGSIPANGACTVTVDVNTNCTGSLVNTLPAGALTTDRGNNTAPATSTLTITDATNPTVVKSFNPATIKAGGISTLTITLRNPNNAVATLTAPFTDSLPSGITVSGSATTTCGGTLTAVKGSSKVTLTGGSIPANGSCKITVKVTATAVCASRCTNTLPVGALRTSRGNNSIAAYASLTVNNSTGNVPGLTKSFSPSTIQAGGVSTLTITLSNPNPTAATLTGPLTDYLPNGVTVSGGATTTCGGTVTAATGSAKVVLNGGSIPANGSCRVTVRVAAAATCDSQRINTLPAGALQTNKGANAVGFVATLTVSNNTAARTALKLNCGSVR